MDYKLKGHCTPFTSSSKSSRLYFWQHYTMWEIWWISTTQTSQFFDCESPMRGKQLQIEFLKSGLKPVQLLYKSLAEVRRDVGKKEAQSTYEKLETERQQKLEMCRKIRNELLMQGYPYSTKSSTSKELQSSKSTPCRSPASPEDQHQSGSYSRSYPESPDLYVKPTLKGQILPFPTLIKEDKPISEESITSIEKVIDPILPPALEPELSPFEQTEGNVKPMEQINHSPFPSLVKSETRSLGSVNGIAKSPELSKCKSGNQRKKFTRSMSLPSRPDTPKDRSIDSKLEKLVSSAGSSVQNNDKKPSITSIDFEKTLHRKKSESIGSLDTFLAEAKQDNHVYFQDINNNHFKTPAITKLHPFRRKKHLEKKKMIECKRVFDQIQAQYKNSDYCLLKYKQIIDNSIERELREQEVKKVQRRIDEGYEMWQDKILMLQWLDSERAEEQVSRNLMSKMEKMKQKQRNKEIVHAINLNKVKEEDDIKAEILRREVNKKERKIQVLQEEKERVIFESKSRALAVSELKQQLRNIMTPETFDQKVTKCGRDKKIIRVLHPPSRCSSIMQQSHISLG